MRSVVVIPARYKSSRFPGKPLVSLCGKPMVIWVAELSAKAVGLENVYVATEDTRIKDVVSNAGFKVIMTSDNALTGTDRIAEASDHINADVFLNVQGDEPLLNPTDINNILEYKLRNPAAVINGFCYLSADENPENINIPKVITTDDNNLVYISRKPLPGFKSSENKPSQYKKQVCIYAFNKEELELFRNFGHKSYLELCEDIEILRFFEFGKRIIMVETSNGSLAVDVPDDVVVVEAAMKRSGVI